MPQIPKRHSLGEGPCRCTMGIGLCFAPWCTDAAISICRTEQLIRSFAHSSGVFAINFETLRLAGPDISELHMECPSERQS